MFSSAVASSARLVPASRQAWGNNSTAARAHIRASDDRSSPIDKAEVDHLTDGTSTKPPPLLPSSPRGRRQALAAALAAAAASAPSFLVPAAPALAAFQPPGFKKDLKKGARRRGPLPPEAFSAGPEGLKYYDFKVGTGPEATLGDRVVVHYEARWNGEERRDRGGDFPGGGVGNRRVGLGWGGKQNQAAHGNKKK